MKLYRARIQTASLGCLQFWHASRRDAERAARDWLKENGDEDNASLSDIDRVDVPTDRAGLLRWLNVHFDTDNG